jgi:mannosyltransferase OCH1-like enzyme
MIKKIHIIYIQGQEAFSKTKYYPLSLLWAPLFPDFEVKVWSELDFLPLMEQYSPQLVEIYKLCPSFSSKSDIARYIILYYHGGLYADTDYEPFTNFSYLFFNTDLVLVTMHYNHSKQCFQKATANGAFMYAGTLHHPLFSTLLDSMVSFPDSQKSAPDYAVEVTGPGALGKHIQDLDFKNNLRVRLLPHTFVEVADFANITLADKSKNEILKERPYAIGCHRLEGSWVPSSQNAHQFMAKVYASITDYSDFYIFGLTILSLLLFFICLCLIVHLIKSNV